MNSITTVIDQLDWSDISTQLDQEGFAIIPGFLHSIDLLDCIQLFNAGPDQRRLNLSGKLQGRGEVIYWTNELPDSLGALRAALYQPLARIANQWNATLEKPYRYPQDLAEFHAQCPMPKRRTAEGVVEYHTFWRAGLSGVAATSRGRARFSVAGSRIVFLAESGLYRRRIRLD